jgi:CheY-like chemotaxis protein
MKMKVLYVEDDPLLRIATKRVLEKQYEITLAEDGIVALDLIQKEHFDCVVSDIMMPGLTGIQLHALIAEKYPEVAARFIFLSGEERVEDTLRSLPPHGVHERSPVSREPCAVREVIDGGR